MNQITKQISALFVTCSYALQILQPAFAAEKSADVYPAPPMPPTDAFAPQWKAPDPTLTGRSKMPKPANINPSAPFTDFTAEATLDEVDSACLTVIPLKSPAQKKSGVLRDDKIKGFLKNHHQRGGVLHPESVVRLEAFLAQNPDSQFRYTLLMELADAQWRHGWFTKSLDSFRSAWGLGKTFQEPQEAELGQMALVRLLTGYSQLGARESLKALLDEAKVLNLSAAAMESYRKAETTLWHLENKAEQNIFCGFTALNAICVPRGLRPAFPDVHDDQERKVFVENGLSVAELIAHSHESGGKSIAVKLRPGARIPVPSVVHWKFNHYSAITRQEGERYFLEDTHLKFTGWIEKKVLDENATGVFVLPDPAVPHERCVDLNEGEMKSYFGRHWNS